MVVNKETPTLPLCQKNTLVRFTALLLALLFFFSLTFPQSFSLVKTILLLVLTLSILAVFFSQIGKIVVDTLVIQYYLAFFLVITIWSLLSVFKGNPMTAIVDHLRLYFVFMWIYALFVIFASSISYEKYFSKLVSMSVVFVSLINFYVVTDFVLEMDSISGYIRKEMLLEVGIHQGYTQLNSLNIGTLSFSVPFLIYILMSRSEGRMSYVSIVVFVSILALVLASRRAILFVVFLSPFLAYIVSKVTQGDNLLRPMLVIYFIYFIFIAAVMIVIYFYYPGVYQGFVERMLEVFISDKYSIRSVQHEALFQGFLNNPLLGSGFGGQVDVIRSVERPWVFEATYSQMLFNFGLLGVTFWFILFSLFAFIVVLKLRRFGGNKSIYNAMLVGFVSVMLAAYTNPYLGSFDYIFVLSIIPMILNSLTSRRADPASKILNKYG